MTQMQKLYLILFAAAVVSLFIFHDLARADIIDEMNTVRATPLIEDKVLNKYALIRCKTMTEWSHNGFLSIAYDVMYTYGKRGIITRYKDVGENLAVDFPTAGSTMQAWMNSPGHRSNIERKIYSRVGSATCRNVVGTTTVVLFGGK